VVVVVVAMVVVVVVAAAAAVCLCMARSVSFTRFVSTDSDCLSLCTTARQHPTGRLGVPTVRCECVRKQD